MDYTYYQKKLLDQIKGLMTQALPANIEQAYLDTPRHLFIHKYFLKNEKGSFDEIPLDETNRAQYYAELYGNTALALVLTADFKAPSTISQPSLVLMMLADLKIESGHKILELGTASGWNAAMLGRLVGEQGAVHSIEIIPALAASAKKTIANLGLEQVNVIAGDGAFGYADGAPYDRIIFTVGSYDIPKTLQVQLKEGGLLLMVLKNRGLGDNLLLLQKKEDHFEVLKNSTCSFVPLTGAYQMEHLNPIALETISFWPKIKNKEVVSQAFWWGMATESRRMYQWKLMGIVSFLEIVVPNFQMFRSATGICFGLVDEASQSIALWKNDRLIAYGNTTALDELKEKIQWYTNLGMPGSSCFNLKIYPKDKVLKLKPYQWVVIRQDIQLLWSLEAHFQV